MHHSYYRSYIAIFLVLLSLNIGIHASENTTENANSETVSDHSVQNTTTSAPITTSHLTTPISISSGGAINNGNASPVAMNPASNGTAQGSNSNGTEHETTTQMPIVTSTQSHNNTEINVSGITGEISEGKSSSTVTTSTTTTAREVTVPETTTTRGEVITSDITDAHISSTVPSGSSTEHTHETVTNDLAWTNDVTIFIACISVSSFLVALMIWGVCYSRINNRNSHVENERFRETFKLFVHRSRPLDDYDRVQFQRLVED